MSLVADMGQYLSQVMEEVFEEVLRGANFAQTYHTLLSKLSKNVKIALKTRLNWSSVILNFTLNLTFYL